MPDDDAVVDYCDRCGNVIAWGSVRTVVTSSDAPDRVLCGSCTEALHRELLGWTVKVAPSAAVGGGSGG